ncbi:putative ABC transport system permease protein [Seinonella peptonophila]|uniref:Putative ABC transport system permease protein n=1 Tax=Seinonella peptonophila TaxID=112248 RepID=A0A1M4XW57_9BACL|nr:ABC transporter permease [Seinonella peptonophila]SHE97660.1 putative ABC transport system permease protein [Seinonella peptonophila]
MSLWESIRMALDAIFVHKMRSILTMLGIIIGVAAVIIIVSIGQGGTTQLTKAITGSGNRINLQVKQDDDALLPPSKDEIHFTAKDIQDLRFIPGVKEVITVSMKAANVRYLQKKSPVTTIYGINNQMMLDLSGLKLAKGRMFNAADYQSGNGGAIISENVAVKLFPGKEPLGQLIMVAGSPIRVIGVLQKPDGIQAYLPSSTDLYLPAQTWRTVFGQLKIDQLSIQLDDAMQMKSVGKQAVQVLNHNHNKRDGYEVENIEQLTQGINQAAQIMTTVVGSIGAISLLVGGIGVMNIMLVSVTERTREIGIRKALGATRSNILMQFLIEAVTLCVLGGGIGILLGSGVAYTLTITNVWPATVSIPVAIGGVLFSMLFGIIFGLLPANKAARLNPIECLRYE